MKRISPIRPRTTDSPALLELKQSLQHTQSELNLAYNAFDYANDPDLTESCIFEIQALQSRMNYLVRQIKEQELSAASVRRTRWL
ncbi:MAG: DUF2508 family protein [Oscillospiraceae bacterium]|nr:DUF2508 family protein [Oscillospiraceae bacterium]